MNLTAANTAIVLDSTADFPDARDRFPNWRVVPLYVNFGTESYKADADATPAPGAGAAGPGAGPGAPGGRPSARELLVASASGLAARAAGAGLLIGIGLLTIAEAGWAHVIGVVGLFCFIAFGFVAVSPAELAAGSE